MQLSEHDKQTMQIINEQMKQLREEDASDSIILSTLMDFVPDVKCIMDSTDEAQLDIYLSKFEHFAYFAKLIANLNLTH